jgi:hypothetical protein
MTIEHPNIGSFTYTATKLELNQAMDPSRFVLAAPPGAKVVNLDEQADKNGSETPSVSVKTITLDEARAAATADAWKLLEPSYLPADSTLIGVTQVEMPLVGKGITLSYSSPKSDFIILQGKAGADFSIDKANVLAGNMSAQAVKAEGRKTPLRGVEGRAFAYGANGWVLIWPEKDSSVVAAVQGNLVLSEIIKIAEGLK